MGLRLIIAVTDSDWFDFLRARSDLDEVNFWSPSGNSFKALQRGELFLFKLHAPRNFIVGAGVFAHASVMPCSLAWQAFGVGNGAPSFAQMRARIAHYRRVDPSDRSDFLVGCRILTQPVFFDERDWIPVSESWSPNIVSFKGYDAEAGEGRALWEAVQERWAWEATSDLPADAGERFGKPVLVKPRLGQGAFRMLVTDLYQRRCAVTGEKTLPALDAAHIRPYGEGGAHEARNGLLLRKDVHSLFDAGYVTVTPDFRFEVSGRIREEFENGRHYYALHGQQARVPNDPVLQPSDAYLRWHNEECYRG